MIKQILTYLYNKIGWHDYCGLLMLPIVLGITLNYKYLIVGWCIVCTLSFLLYLRNKINDNATRISVFAFIILIHVPLLIVSLNSIINNDDDNSGMYEKAIGEFIKEENDNLIYKIRRSNGTTENINIKKGQANANEIKQMVLLRTNPNKIIVQEPDSAQISKYKYAVQCYSHYTTENIGINSFDYAKYNPKSYFENFGLEIVYKAKIKDINDNNYSVTYNNIWGNKEEAMVICQQSKIRETDSILISVIIKADTKYPPSFFGWKEDYPTLNNIGYCFLDTLVNA